METDNEAFVFVSASKEPCLLDSASLEDAVAKDLGLVPDVQAIFIERADNNLLVWIAIDRPTEATRERVFQKQGEIIDGFPEVSFDFNIVSANVTPEHEFAVEAKQVFSRG